MCSSRDLQLLITVTVLDCHRDSDRCLRVIGCDKREAFAQGSEATKQSILPSRRYGCIRNRSLSHGGQLDSLAMTDSSFEVAASLLPAP